MSKIYPVLSAEEAVTHIHNGNMIAFSGFTPAGSPKIIPRALAEKAKTKHQNNEAFKVKLITGASISAYADDRLAHEQALEWRAPYQTAPLLRQKINEGEINFVDLHLSEVAQMVSGGFFGDIDIAVIEACDITPDGRVFLTSGIGNSPTFLQRAKRVIIELNRYHSTRLLEITDIVILGRPPRNNSVPIYHTMDKVGLPFVQIDPKKVIGIVETNLPDEFNELVPKSVTECQLIANNVVKFLYNELKMDRLPRKFLPIQSGVGNINNAIMQELGISEDIPPFYMYSEVLQESIVPLLESGKVKGASASSLTVQASTLEKIYNNMNFFSEKIILRPQEVSNNPEVIRRLGVIALNVGLEFDIYGHANSTHINGYDLINGIGGSGDFERNAYLSIFMAPSIAKRGNISTIVPMCTHVDHSEHSVKIIITEQGIADLRGLSPIQRAHSIIKNCAHPAYKDYLYKYLENSKKGHLYVNLETAFDLHKNLINTGSMLSK